MDCSVPPP